MKINNQIKLIKIVYISVLIAGFVISMIIGGLQGFKDGWNGVQKANHHELSFLQVLLMLVIVFLALRIFIYLYRFISSVEFGEVFSEINIHRLFLIGWYCILMPLLLLTFNYSNFDNLGFDNLLNVNFEFWLLILGITLLTISFVFKKGIELKQENDLTI